MQLSSQLHGATRAIRSVGNTSSEQVPKSDCVLDTKGASNIFSRQNLIVRQRPAADICLTLTVRNTQIAFVYQDFAWYVDDLWE